MMFFTKIMRDENEKNEDIFIFYTSFTFNL